MSKQRTINATAEWGASVEAHRDGNSLTLIFKSRKHKIKVKVDDSRIADIAMGFHKVMKMRREYYDAIDRILKGQ